MNDRLTGTGVALATPLNRDTSLDYDGLEILVNHVIDGGVDYLVVLGTTAESVTLNHKEKERVKAIVSSTNKGRVPMVLGIGGNNTAEVVKTIKETDWSDYDALLSVSPSYNKPTQEGIYRHFKQVALACEKPVILYNVPSRTASNILPDTVLRLARDFENIIGIKEAGGVMSQAMRLLQNKPKDFMVISGDDMLALPMILAGGAGVISVIGQGFPKSFSTMVRLGLQGKTKEAYQLHYSMMDMIEMIFEEGNPAGIKMLLKKKGICKEHVRLPLVSLSDELKNRIFDFEALP